MKGYFIFLMVLLLNKLPGYSQEIEWQRTLGGSGNDLLNCVAPTSDGGIICGGWSNSAISGDKTVPCNGSYDYWIIKLEGSGNIEWQKSIGGIYDDRLYDIRQTLDGGYICGGSSQSTISGDKTVTNFGSYDYWVVKLDSLGSIQWQNALGGDLEDVLLEIKQTFDKGYICAGYSISNISGNKNENSWGQYDYWVVKLDSAGTIMWQNDIGGIGDDLLWSIEQTLDGGFLCGGYSKSNISGDKTESTNGVNDFWLVKLDSAGGILWQNSIGGNSDDRLNRLLETSDGGFTSGGCSSSGIGGDIVEYGNGAADYWIVHTNDVGIIEWQNKIGGGSNDFLEGLEQTPDGGYFCGGTSASDISGDKSEDNLGLPIITPDFWVLKLDSIGNIIWQNTLGGNGYDWVWDICMAGTDGMIAAGYSNSNISGDKSEDSRGLYDYWIVKLSSEYNSITGIVFADFNSNLLQDAGEPSLKNKVVRELNSGNFTFTGKDGDFNMVVFDTGQFAIVPEPMSYYNSIPFNHTAYFSSMLQTDTANNFVYQPIAAYNDLCVSLTPLGPMRAGRQANYCITYTNEGTTSLSGTVIFYLDSNMTFYLSSPAPLSVTSDSIVWSLGMLDPFASGNILVTVHINIGTPIGTLIYPVTRIEPLVGDANPSCNVSTYEMYTVGSVDPNAILVNRENLETSELINPPYLDYIVYFQNTGNDTAFTVSILNPLDTSSLDLASFGFLSSSHPVSLTYSAWEKCFRFMFENILLADSNINEPASHGYVRYHIRPKGSLISGDTIVNQAHIYFDYNEPVPTNLATTAIILPTSMLHSNTQSAILVYPNPSTTILTIASTAGSINRIEIHNMIGQTVLIKEPGNNEEQKHLVDVTGFKNGIYLIVIYSTEGISQNKLIVVGH